MQNKAQGAIEYLLIIGASLLIVAIVLVTLVYIMQSGQQQNNSGAKIENSSMTGLEREVSQAAGKILIVHGETLIFTPTDLLKLEDMITGLPEGTLITVDGENYPGGTIPPGTTVTITNTTTNFEVPEDNPLIQVLQKTANLVPINGDGVGIILRKDGTKITTQQKLEEAYQSGEIKISYNGNEISVIQKDSTATYSEANVRGCYKLFYKGYRGDGLVFDGGQEVGSATTMNKFAKITQATDTSVIGKTFQFINQVGSTGVPNGKCCYICADAPCSSLKGLNTTCNDTQVYNPVNGTNTQYMGTETAGWKVKVYDYNLVLGTTPTTGQVSLNTTSGIISGIPLYETKYFTCTSTITQGYTNYSKMCCAGAGCCQGTPNCTENCTNFSCDTSTCELSTYETEKACEDQPYNIPLVTIDYYTFK